MLFVRRSKKNNFYVIKPIESGLGANVPYDFQMKKSPPEKTASFFAQYFNAPVLIDGQVLINKADRGNGYRIENPHDGFAGQQWP